MLSPTAGNFFAVVKSFDNNIAVIGNFALIAKNWNAVIDIEGTKQDSNVHLIDVVSSNVLSSSLSVVRYICWYLKLSYYNFELINFTPEVYWWSLTTAIENVPV